MSGASSTPGASSDQLELILQHVDALPTLGAVVARLLAMTSSAEASASDVVKLIETDPSLTGRVLRACRRSERGRALKIGTVERAVVLMGFEAVRAAALSVQVFEVLDHRQGQAGSEGFDRIRFWRHCVATAVLAERIATRKRSLAVDRGEAFTAGLLHDLGHLALHAVLPQTYERIATRSEQFLRPMDESCSRIIGMDTHAIGKRLGERWGLPTRLIETIWLNGQVAEAFPESSPRALISMVTLADALARKVHLAPRGQAPNDELLRAHAAQLEISESECEQLAEGVHEEVAHRAAGLGLDDQPPTEVLLDALARANELLARHAETRPNERRSSKIALPPVEEIRSLYASTLQATSIHEAIRAAGSSAARSFGGRLTAAIFSRLDDVFAVVQTFDERGATLTTSKIPPDDFNSLGEAPVQPISKNPDRWAAWIGRKADRRAIAVRIAFDSWTAAFAIEEPRTAPAESSLQFLIEQWRLTIEVAARHERSSALSEQLVLANRRLAATRDELVRKQAMASLGEMTCGVAHEFNNPLTVISSRAQLVRENADDPDQRIQLLEIIRQAQRLSDMVSALNEISRPLNLTRMNVDATDWLRRVVAQVDQPDRIAVHVPAAARQVRIDPRLMSEVIEELVQNARDADPNGKIAILVQSDPLDGRWMLRLADDGPGLSERGLAHAFDPFFSEKPAGRKMGLGLARARRIVEAHGGELSLQNRSPRGAVATIRLPQPRLSGRLRVAAA